MSTVAAILALLPLALAIRPAIGDAAAARGNQGLRTDRVVAADADRDAFAISHADGMACESHQLTPIKFAGCNESEHRKSELKCGRYIATMVAESIARFAEAA